MDYKFNHKIITPLGITKKRNIIYFCADFNYKLPLSILEKNSKTKKVQVYNLKDGAKRMKFEKEGELCQIIEYLSSNAIINV